MTTDVVVHRRAVWLVFVMWPTTSASSKASTIIDCEGVITVEGVFYGGAGVQTGSVELRTQGDAAGNSGSRQKFEVPVGATASCTYVAPIGACRTNAVTMEWTHKETVEGVVNSGTATACGKVEWRNSGLGGLVGAGHEMQVCAPITLVSTGE